MPNPQNLKPFTGKDDPRRGHGVKGMTHSSTRLKRLLALTEQLKNPVTGEIEGFTVLEQLDLQQIIKARKGDTKAYGVILDRLEGKAKQTVEASVAGSVDVSDPQILKTLLLTAQAISKEPSNETTDTDSAHE